MERNIIYLDNAATTYPKPWPVLHTMVERFHEMGVSPGRGGYDLAAETEDLVHNTRQKLAMFFGAPDPDRVIFTSNATDALNTAIQGLVRPGDHVVSSWIEHNSVLRPLYHLRQQGIIEYDLVSFNDQGFIDPGDVARAIKDNTRLVVISHASNVLGTLQPVREIGLACSDRNIHLLVDAAQSAGVIPIDISSSNISALAFTGHKSLLGPTGTGGLVMAPGLDLQATRFGGTGVDSESLVHTPTLPHRLEAGTLNLMGIIGLSEGIDFIIKQGIESIHQREMALLSRLRKGLSKIESINLYCAENLSEHVALLLVNIEGIDPVDAGAILDADFNIAVRAGLHCAPLVHETIGTYPRGGIRFSPGPFNSEEDIEQAVDAMAMIAG